MSRTTVARLLLLVSVVMAVGLIVVGGAIKPGYSHVSQYISELNATGTPWASEIGWLGFAPLAVVLFIFLIVAYPSVEVEGVSRLGYLLMFTQPLAYITATIAPCDDGGDSVDRTPLCRLADDAGASACAEGSSHGFLGLRL